MPHSPATADSRDAPESPQARAERLEREIAERDDLLAIAGHELRNPLHALSLQLTLARTGAQANGEAETAARLAKAQTMLLRYSNRVTLLMDLIRSQRGIYPLNPQRVDLNTLLAGITDGLQQEARFRGVMLTMDMPVRCHVIADPLLVEQIVDNLLINAFKHAACSEVRLTLHPPAEGELRISVADNGRGIALEDQARIFGKFGVAQVSPRGGGTGLGLWIVRQLAATLGGTVTLTSSPGAGSVFTLHLPSPDRDEP